MIKRLMTLCSMLLLALAALPAYSGDKTYEVTITNLTRGQTFTPILVATHRRAHPIFELGSAASVGLATIAESGNDAPLKSAIMESGLGYDAASSGGLLGPGESVSVQVKSQGAFRYLSLASMLIPTNDAFFAINGMRLPGKHGRVVMSPAYDAGSENNDELCANIPGPVCGGAGLSEEGGEGYVHIHAGIHGIGDLPAATYDWRNPVAKISIRRVKDDD